MCPLLISTCQVPVLAERSEILHSEKEAARWWKRKKKGEKSFSCHFWKSPLHWRTIIKIKNCRSVWRWNRMLSLSSIWAQFCVMPSWDSLCIFITRAGGKSFSRDPAAMLQLLRGDLISSRLQVYGWKHMSNVLAQTPQWPVLTHSVSPFDEVYYVA